jgi:hypothetical protein
MVLLHNPWQADPLKMPTIAIEKEGNHEGTNIGSAASGIWFRSGSRYFNQR